MARCRFFGLPKQAPLEWVLEVNKTPIRNFMIIVSVALAFQGFSLSMSAKSLTAACFLGCAVVGSVVGFLFIYYAQRLSLGPIAQMSVIVAWFVMVVGFLGIGAPFSEDYTFRVRYHASYAWIWKPVPQIMGFHIIASVIMILFSCIVDFVTYELCAILHGDARETRIYMTSLIASFTWIGIACFTSVRFRNLFDTQEALAAEKALMESMFGMMCDGIAWLSEDGTTILRTDWRFEVVLGKSVVGESINTAVKAEEKQRFQDGLIRAKTEPVLLPSTLVTQAKVEVPISVFIVGNRDLKVQAGGSKPIPAFLIGIRHDAKPDTLIPEGRELSIRHMTNFEATVSELGGVAPLAEDERSALSSMPTTTATGRAFENINVERIVRANDPDMSGASVVEEAKVNLERVTRLGRDEGWLLVADDVEMEGGAPLGAGAFGQVSRGWLHGSPVAAKSTHTDPEGRVHAKQLAAIANEVRILRHLRHPNIVLFRGACIDPDGLRVTMVMERVDGCELLPYITSFQPNAGSKQRRQLLLDVSCALWYLHALRPQVIHGDLKDTNILVESATPRAKLLDFGLSRCRTKDSDPLGGSLIWMAPEIICGYGQPCAAADVFSFGRVACLVVTSKRPLQQLARKAIIDAAKRGRSHRIVWQEGAPLHAECASLCKRALALVPERRPDMARLHRDIRAWVPPAPPAQEEGPTSSAHLAGGASASTPPRAAVGLVGALRRLAGFGRANTVQQAAVVQGSSQAAAAEAPANARAPAVGATTVQPVAGPTIQDAASRAAQGSAPTAEPRQPNGDGRAVPQPVLAPPLPLALPHRRRTQPHEAKLLLMETAARINFPRAPDSCCYFHPGVIELQRLCVQLMQGPCKRHFLPVDGFQCPICGVLDSECDEEVCPTCGHAIRMAAIRDAAGAADDPANTHVVPEQPASHVQAL